MPSAPAWRRYLRFLRPNLEADIDDELRFHLESRRDEFVRGGGDPHHADAATLRRFGDIERVRSEVRRIDTDWQREVRWKEWLESVKQDVRYALRQLARSRGFTIAATLTLALGIGANSTLFSLVDALLLKPLPAIREPERLLEMSVPSISYPAYRDFREATTAFSALAAFSQRKVALVNGDRTELLSAGAVSGNYFGTLGVAASHGRVLVEGDDQPGAPLVGVISDALWRRSFDRDPSVVGRAVRINGFPVTIVGIAPEGFRGTRLNGIPSVWLAVRAWHAIAPLYFKGLTIERRNWSWLTMVGRLRTGVSQEQATAMLRAAADQQERSYPKDTRTGFGRTIRVTPASEAALPAGMHSGVVQFTFVLSAVVAAVLLIACANVANLLLARAAQRRREIAVRLSLGAERRRLIRQLFTETLVLATLAGGVAVGATALAAQALGAVSLPGSLELATLGIAPDGRVLAFTGLITVLTGLVFGLAPALHGSRVGVAIVLREGAQGEQRARARLRGALLAAQVSLSLVLLIGAGLFTRGLQRALSIDPGFDGERIAVATVDVGLARFDTLRAAQYYSAALARIQRQPGIDQVAWAWTVPLSEDQNTESFKVDGYVPREDEQLEAEMGVVSPGYLTAFGIPLVRGRDLNDTDLASSPRVAVINETMAKRYWRDGDALGKQISLFAGPTTVVGIVRDVAYHELREDPRPFLYLPLTQRMGSAGLLQLILVAKTTGDPNASLGTVQRELRAVSPEVPVFGLGTFADLAGAVVMPQRFGAVLLGVFGLLALLIASVGVYGVISFSVQQRSREIGIRIALGARPVEVVRFLLAQSMRSVTAGLVIGLALSVASTRLLTTFLYGVSATDAVTFGTTSLILVATALLASYLPARRATRVDPVSTLRAD